MTMRTVHRITFSSSGGVPQRPAAGGTTTRHIVGRVRATSTANRLALDFLAANGIQRPADYRQVPDAMHRSRARRQMNGAPRTERIVGSDASPALAAVNDFQCADSSVQRTLSPNCLGKQKRVAADDFHRCCHRISAGHLKCVRNHGSGREFANVQHAVRRLHPS